MIISFLLRAWRSLLWATFVLAGFTSPAWALADAVSFDEAVGGAVTQAPLLVAGQARADAARAEAARAAALPDPRLILGVANLPVTGADAFDPRVDDMTTKQIGLMQEFPAKAKREARQMLATRTVEQTVAQTLADRLAVREATAAAWIATWSAQRQLAALTSLREPTSTAARTAKARVAGGTATVTDALATQAAVLELDNRIEAAQAEVDAAQSDLSRWLGRPEPIAVRGEPPRFDRLPIEPDILLTSVEDQGPLLSWRAREASAEAEVAAAIAEKRSDWSLEVNYGQRDRAPDGMPRSDMLMVEVSIGLPVFARNRQDRGIAARRAELQAVAAEREDARRVQQAAVRRTLVGWQAAQRQVMRLEQDTLPLARDRSAVALAAYAGGANLQAWLDARNAEIELQLEHARLLGELGRAWAALAYLLPDKELQP